MTLANWLPSVAKLQYMGKTSTVSRLNLPGRYAWAAAELVGPLNMLYIIYNLPSKLNPPPTSSSSILGTGLPFKHELVASLYLLHYLNRAFITPIFLAPSMSPIHASVAIMMVIFQFTNSSCIASWLVYSASAVNGQDRNSLPEVARRNYQQILRAILPGTTASSDPSHSSTLLTSPIIALGLVLFALGLLGNILSENALFDLRRGAAKRKAKSEGKARVTYDKVYVIPPAKGWFKYILSPHYVTEWVEWLGYWVLAGGLGLGWNTPALWFLVNELVTMSPRAVTGRRWYVEKFGKRAVGGRGGILPVEWL